MRPITKTIKRGVKIRSSDPALGSVIWVITIGPGGLLFKRAGEHESERFGMSWRSVISHALMHRGKFGVSEAP